ncbi:MAG: NUDIX domain-containing protein [Bacteroidota bacterium]
MELSNRTIIPDLSVDCVILSFKEGNLRVLLIKRDQELERGKWALPGGFVYDDEDIDEASRRVLKEHTGAEEIYLEQLEAFGRVNRFPGKRVITLAYHAHVRPDVIHIQPGPEASEAIWQELSSCPPLVFDHDEILGEAVKTLKRKTLHEPVGLQLLPEKFTLWQLQQLYEAITGEPLEKSNFRRKINRLDYLIPLEEFQKGVAHRAARLYQFDAAKYAELAEKGFLF